MEYWTSLFYFVGAGRKDGTAPSLEKALDGKIFYTFDEAEYFRRVVSADVGYGYKVFSAVAIIPRLPAVTEEIGTYPPFSITVELKEP